MSDPAGAPDPNNPDIFTAYGSNGFRLTLREWGIVLLLSVLFVALAPALWKRAEKIEAGPDTRMNVDLSNDYWLYSREAESAAARCDTLVIGDSVVWGQYAARNETLSHYLNELAGSERTANLGLDGAHPMALAGLIDSYAGSVSNKTVILVCNLLWMSSPKHDLQLADEFHFNHSKLVPQFFPRIPCYKAEVNERLSSIVERNFEFNEWTGHIQSAYFDRMDIPAWTLEHPYTPLYTALTFTLPEGNAQAPHDPTPWTEQGIQKQDFPFVELKTSLQWSAFQRALEILQTRGNRVCVVVSPLNEHMMNESSRQAYLKIRGEIETWLTEKKINAIAPPVLPSEMYADASHPLAAGYEVLAKQIYDKFLAKP